MSPIKILAIGGTAKSSGKTAVGAFLAPHLGSVAAVRVTPKHKTSLAGIEIEPAISAENAQPRPFVIETSPELLLAKGADTRRYWDAGAEPVYWLRAKDEAIVDGVNEIVRSLEQRREGPSWLIVEGTRYLAVGGRADVALMVYPNGSKDFDDADCDLSTIRRCDALVVSKRRPGNVILRLLDHEDYPQDRLDLPVFAFNVDSDSLAQDERFAMVDWLRDRVMTVGARAASGASGEGFLG